jgi:UDP-N-acetylglucosamine 2-epimerase
MRILVAFGTRPEIIKLAPVCRALQRSGVDLDVFLVWAAYRTGRGSARALQHRGYV